MATPYDLLLGMSLLRDKKRKEHQEVADSLDGATFLRIRVNHQNMLILQDEVKEVLPFVKMAEIKSPDLRISGFGSFKGELLPVIDLNDLPALTQQTQVVGQYYEANANARVLVIQINEQLVGVKVDAVLGIQHYWLNAQEVDNSESSWFQAWIMLEDGDQMTERLPVLNMQGIAKYCRMEANMKINNSTIVNQS